MEYSTLKDEELVILSKKKDTEALDTLLNRHFKTVNSVVRNYYINDGDSDDLTQIGLIAVFKAINSYNDGNVSFKNYAISCIKNAVFSAIKRSNSYKNKPLYQFITLSSDEGNEIDKSSIAISLDQNPESKYINSESENEINTNLRSILSKLEFCILDKYLQGYSYFEISNVVKKDVKSIDNAIQRIKKKISKYIKRGE